MLARLRPKYIWVALTFYTLGMTVWGWLAVGSPQVTRSMFRAGSGASLCWYSLGALLAWRIAKTYASRSRMRLAWLLMGWSATATVARHVFQIAGWWSGGWDDPRVDAISGLRQLPTVLSLILLGASLIVMWSAFRAVGVDIRFHPVDLVLVLLALTLLPIIMSHYANIPDANALLRLARGLQYATPFLVVATATLSVLLYRISAEMGGGEFSKCLRALTAFLLLRLAGHLLFTFPWGHWTSVIQMFGRIIWTANNGVFVLGLAYRWEIGRLADSALARYEADALQRLSLPSASAH
jgi:hypothetical protein